jgi:hypothetical protein
VGGGRDLAEFLGETEPGEERDIAWLATAKLLLKLESAGARHPDLNLANVLLAPDENGALEAWVLDVDRVWFDEPLNPRITEANLRRLQRSARKQREQRGLSVSEAELARVERIVREEST